MIRSAVRELAAARTVPLICATFVETTAQIWDVVTQHVTGEFSTRFAFGAKTLAMHPDGEFVVTGVSAKTGTIACYRVPDGESIWLRYRMPYPAHIRFSQSGQHISCTLSNRRVERAIARTGATTEVLENTIHYIEGPNGYVLLAPSSASSYVLRGESEISIPKLTFAILDVAFGPDILCITESAGPVRCIDCLTGAQRWRYTPPDGSHILKLSYNHLGGFFYGVLSHYEKGHFRYLMRFDKETGQQTNVCNLTSWDEVFIEVTHQLLTSSGQVIDLSNGEVVGELAFGRKEYPDRFTSP